MEPLLCERIYSVMNDDHVTMFEKLDEIQNVIDRDADRLFDYETYKERVVALVNHLITEVSAHTMREEVLMKAFNYPGQAQHRMEHAFLIRTLETHCFNFNQSLKQATKDNVRYTRDWLCNHMKTTDKSLDIYLESNRRPADDFALLDVKRYVLPPLGLALGVKKIGLWAKLTFSRSPVESRLKSSSGVAGKAHAVAAHARHTPTMPGRR
jgi:hemerythrin-like metal-binding protein